MASTTTDWKPMFKLFRYYSLASAIAIVAVTAVLVAFYRQNAVNELITTAENQNVSLARSFANTLWPRFSSYVVSVSGEDGEALRAHPETQEIHEALAVATDGLPVLKVKIYDLNGLTVYSSEPSQIGADKSINAGFLASAEEGIPASKLSFRDTFSAFSGVVENRDLIESYLPILGDGGTIEGVFELYTDVTPLMRRIDDVTVKLALGVLLVLGLLYGVLSLIVRRADSILKHQYSDLLHSKETIEAQNTVIAEQSFNLGLGEMAAGVLHNVRNQLSPLTLRIGKLKQIAQPVPTEKLELSLEELAASDTATDRREKLRKYVSLSVDDFAKRQNEASDQLESIAALLGKFDTMLDEQEAIGQAEHKIEPVNVLDVAAEVVGMTPMPKNVKVKMPDRLHDLHEISPVLAERFLLKQILINLVVNAMESITATDRPDGEIEIVIENETFVGREWVHVQVKDNGRGIDGATLIDIFQRGFSTKEGKKRGFGLHWCANTLVAMNGRIEAASKGIAKGAVFHIYLPTEREVARAA